MTAVPAGDGEQLGDGPDGLQILEDGTHTDRGLAIVRGVLPPGAGGPPQHRHREHSETFYVLAGTVRFLSASEHVDISEGGLFTASVGVPHTFANPDPREEATFMCLMTPGFYVDYFRDMAALAAQPGGMNKQANLDLMRRYATDPFP